MQTGGVNNVTNTLTLNGFGTYELAGGRLNAGTINVNSGASFYFDGGTANFTTLNQTGGIVASGSAASSGNGSGTELVSAFGFILPPSAAGGAPVTLSGATFNQSGGTNNAGALILGQNGGVGIYSLSGGTLTAASELIGSGAGVNISPGLFTQIGASTNSVSGAVTVGEGSYYELQGGGMTAVALEVNSGGTLNQSAGSASVAGNTYNSGTVSITAGTFSTGANFVDTGIIVLEGGTLTANTITVNSGGTFAFNGGAANFSRFNLNEGGTASASGDEVLDIAGQSNSTYTFTQNGGANNVAGALVAGAASGNTGAYLLKAGTLSASSETVGLDGTGTFTQTGGTNTASGLTVGGSGSGTYDLQGGTLNATTITVDSGGNFYFDGGTANYTNFDLTSGTVASGTSSSLASAGFAGSGSEVIAGGVGLKLTFTQTGGTNTTDSLAIGSFSTSGGGVGGVFLPGVYDLKADHGLSATTINVNYDGSFYFDFTPLNVAGVHFGPTFTTFNLVGGTVVAGSPDDLAGASGSQYYGTGSDESFAGPGSLTPPTSLGSLPIVTGGETFNQSGGTNYAGDLTLGAPGGKIISGESPRVFRREQQHLSGNVRRLQPFEG